ncbi:hypothetical protein EPN81_04745 [Patescibacteria group bacterium]|nr:MAG: hypothetical protein EPN81_04745 [Patescibacteria group bacterium]
MRTIGESVAKSEQLGVLGEEGQETDGEREHLHFAMYEGEDVRLKGYETSKETVEDWSLIQNSILLSLKESSRA